MNSIYSPVRAPVSDNDTGINGYVMATPLQDITGAPLYALCSLSAGIVTIYCLDDDGDNYPLDTFTLAEYLEMVDDGHLDPDTRRLVINW